MISIIIPTYNAEKYIAETIKSLIAQTLKEWELIIIDDGSTDNTAELIHLLCEKDNRIKYYYQENSGVSVARNKGLEISKGVYVAFLDSDDIWLENNLEKKIGILKNRHDIFWVFSNIIYFNDNDETIETISADKDKVNWLNSLLEWNGQVKTTPSNIVVKREIYSKGEITFDKSLSTAADQDFCIQLASKYKGYFINIPLIRYRVLENSMSSNILLMEHDHIAVYKKANKNKLFKSFWFKQKCFSNLYWIIAGSWWKDGDNKKRGLYFVFKALFINPLSIIKLIKI